MIRACAATMSEPLRERDTKMESFAFPKWNVSSGLVGDDPRMENLGSLSRHAHDGLVELISSQNSEPDWMLQFRQDAYKQWLAMERPGWAADEFHPAIDVDQELQLHSVASLLSNKKQQENVDIDGANIISNTNILEQKFAAAGFGSVSFATAHREALKEAGVIFCSFEDAIREHPELVKKYLGKVIDVADNYYAALNSAVFRGGMFCYVPKNTVCPMDISTYFLPDAGKDVQVNNNFERTLIVCDENASVSYLGCTSPSAGGSRSSSLQLQAPVVELYCARGAEITFTTVQNWDPTVHNFVSKGGLCDGADSKISWVQMDTGSAMTRHRPSVVLRGDRSSAEFFTATLTDARQRADVGVDVVHIGKNTSSRVVARAIAAGTSRNSYHHLCQVRASATGATSALDCDSMLIGDRAVSEVIPCISVSDSSLYSPSFLFLWLLDRLDTTYLNHLALQVVFQDWGRGCMASRMPNPRIAPILNPNCTAP